MMTTVIVVIAGTLMGKIPVPTIPEIVSVKYHLLFMILLPGLFALIGWNKGVQILSPINAVLFINLAPVTTIIIRMVQGHSIQPFEIAGVAIVCSMIIANNLYNRFLQRKITAKSSEKEAPLKTAIKQEVVTPKKAVQKNEQIHKETNEESLLDRNLHLGSAR